MSALAFAACPASDVQSGSSDINPTFCPLSLVPAFADGSLPNVYMFQVFNQRKLEPMERRNTSPTKSTPKPTVSRENNNEVHLEIFSNRPLPSWASSPKETGKCSEETTIKKKDKSEQTPVVNTEKSGNVGSRNFSFFSSVEAKNSDGDMEDDLRIGLTKKSPLLSVYRPPATPEMHQGAARTAAKGRASGSSWESPSVDRVTGAVKNMPVTFHDRVKSSGYGQNKPKQPSFAAKMKKKSSTGSKGTGAEIYSGRTAVVQQGLRSLSAPRQGRGKRYFFAI